MSSTPGRERAPSEESSSRAASPPPSSWAPTSTRLPRSRARTRGAEAARLGQAIYLELERLPIPTVAAIHGPCLGGGTELALACRYRVASDHESTRIGLPEVQLGILPAWGGTTRLPRIVGLRAALEMLLTGDPVRPRKARRVGLADDVLPYGGFHATAMTFLRRAVESAPNGRPRGGIGGLLLEKTPPGRSVLLRGARRRVLQRTGGHYPAPFASSRSSGALAVAAWSRPSRWRPRLPVS